MCFKLIKWGVVGTAVLAVASGVMFGRDGWSYLRSSARSVQTAVKDSVPIEFELKRARDLLDEIIPEMHANVRLIAQEEVEVATLKSDIQRADESLGEERTRIVKLREMLDTERAVYRIGSYDYNRQQVKEELARQFDRFKEAEMMLASKKRLMDAREKALKGAVDTLGRTRAQKTHLEDKIAALEGQYRLVQAASVGSTISVDNSKLAQTERLISEVKKRLDVAERVLAHEAKFVQPIEVDVISEPDLLQQVDEYLQPKPEVLQKVEGSTTQPADSVALSR